MQKALTAAMALSSLLFAVSAAAEEAPGTRDGIYQIVKASENRVWRLNTQTGEIAVCELSGENLLCTTTSDAAQVPKKTYAEIDAERKQDDEARNAERRQQREDELKLLDKILSVIQEFIRTALGKGSEG